MKIKRIISAVTVLSCTAGLIVSPVRAQSSVALSCDSYYGIYEAGETISYTLSGAANVTVTDYFGNVTDLGSFADGATITPDITAVGAYTITAASGGDTAEQRFAVMPKLSERRDSSEGPVAFASMASHTSGKRDNIPGYMRTIKLAGVNYVREFMPAANTIKGVGNYDFTASGTNYHKICDLMQAYKENDIGVLFMYQNMVKDSAAIEENLYLIYDYTKYICNLFDGQMDAIEILNETEGGGTLKTDGPEKYAAALKAAALGAEDSGTGVKVVSASFNGGREQYAKIFAKNGTEDYYDIYNGHYYDDYESDKNIAVYPDDPGKYVEYQTNLGLSDKPLWMTEFGLRIPYETGKVDLTAAQQKQQARTAPVAIIKDIAAGADRVFWFLHGYINENNKCYGDLGSDNKPYPVYSTISALTNALGNAKYSGKIEGLSGGVEAYAFKDNGDTVLAIWSETENTVSVSGSGTISDIMGGETEFSGGTVTVGPDIKYIRVTGDISVNSIAPENVLRSGKSEVTSKIEDSDRIVLLPDFPDGTDAVAKDAYQLSDTNEIGVTVYNFNNSVKKVELSATSNGGWAIDGADTAVTVPAMGNRRITFTVSKTDAVENQIKSLLMISGTVDNKAVTDSVSVIKSKDFITGTAIDFTKKVGLITVDQEWNQVYSVDGATVTDNGDMSDGSRAIKFDFTAADASVRKSAGVSISYGGSISRYKTIDLSGAKGFAVTVKADRAIGDIGTRLWVTDSDGDTFYTHENLNYDTIQSMKTINVDSDSYRQAVFSLENMGDTNTSGDGVLDLSNIVSVSVGFSMYETVNGADLTSDDEIDADSFTMYVKDIIALSAVGFGEVASEPITATASYTDNKIVTELSRTAKAVKHTINGVSYDAEVLGNTAECPLFLDAGVYNITTTAYDETNTAYVSYSTICVDRTGENFVYYYADGASNVPQMQIKKQGESVTLSSLVPEKSFCEFLGWATEPNGEVAFAPGTEYAEDSDLHLYAVFESRNGSIVNELIYKNAALMNFMNNYMTVKGCEKELAGKTTTIIAYRVTSGNGANADTALPDDIVYLNEVKASDNGNYAFSFPFTQEGEYRYSVRVGDTLKAGEFTEVEFGPLWADGAVSLSVSGSGVSYSVKVMNHTGESFNFGTALSTFLKNGRPNMIDWHESAAKPGLVEENFEAVLSEDYKTLKLMLLSKDTATPIAGAVTVTN